MRRTFERFLIRDKVSSMEMEIYACTGAEIRAPPLTVFRLGSIDLPGERLQHDLVTILHSSRVYTTYCASGIIVGSDNRNVLPDHLEDSRGEMRRTVVEPRPAVIACE